ncbi:MAG: GPW/gp25 family protein [Gemmatimonadetes bacterium]|nr:GPW/gp25 family protein [Gemmatimonadota bacterium]MCC6774181.1 GPW/gp25 family protein [Gemmatimonadaceae bacterium]
MTGPTRLDRIIPQMGRDLRLGFAQRGGFYEDADLDAERRPHRAFDVDLARAEGLDTLVQAIAMRLKTRRGELAALGHPGYGSRHHELMGEPNVQRTRDLIKLYVLQALRDEPRIRRVQSVEVVPEHQPPRETVRISLSVEVIDAPTPVNLVLPFSLGVSL